MYFFRFRDNLKVRFGERNKNISRRSFPLVDYEFKAAVLNSDFPAIARAVSKAFYFANHDIKSKYSISLEEAEALYSHWAFTEEYIEAEKINRAFYQRTKRLKNRVEQLLEKPCVFLSLTFTDKTLQNTSPLTRRRYVTEYLRNNYPNYVANIDFGDDFGREHYHAIIQTQKVDYKSWHHLGAIKGEKIVVNNIVALAKYVSKLTNHAIKETTRRSCLIYSR